MSRRKPVGWRGNPGWTGESTRHALSRRGIRTTSRGVRYSPDDYYIPSPHRDRAMEDITEMIDEVYDKNLIEKLPTIAMTFIEWIQRTLERHGIDREDTNLKHFIDGADVHLSQYIKDEEYGHELAQKKFGIFSHLWSEYVAPAPKLFKGELDEIVEDIKSEPGRRGKVDVKKLDKRPYKDAYGTYDWYKIDGDEYLIRRQKS